MATHIVPTSQFPAAQAAQAAQAASPTSKLAPQPIHVGAQAIGHPYSVGRATFYSPGLMEAVARKRGLGMSGATGFATYPDCSQIGEYIEVSVQNVYDLSWSPWASKRIVDCSQPRDYVRHVAEGLVELSWGDAVLYRYSGEGHTEIRYYLVEGGK